MQRQTLSQKQQQRTIPAQIQASRILNLSLIELQSFIECEAAENPALSIEDGKRCPVCGFVTGEGKCPICTANIRPESSSGADESEYYYLKKTFSAANADEAFDPFRTIMSETSLPEYLKGQARISLGGRKLRIAEYIIDSLDSDGYFREPLFETAEVFAAAVPEIEGVLVFLQSLDPAGIAARDLKGCLLNQLSRLQERSAASDLAQKILTDYWEDFSNMRIKTIARKMGMENEEVRSACVFVRERLNPYPASSYIGPFSEKSRESAPVVPDVIIRRTETGFVADVVDSHLSAMRIDTSYENTYSEIKNNKTPLCEEDKKHVKEYVERVQAILDAVELRKKTLARVANYIAEYQSEYLEHGPSRLRPLKQKDLAKELGVHESTICRAVADKLCRLPSQETVPFETFFDAALPIRNMISQLIAGSPKPLSDSEIATHLAENGINIARRTVAKYRNQLRVPSYQLRDMG